MLSASTGSWTNNTCTHTQFQVQAQSMEDEKVGWGLKGDASAQQTHRLVEAATEVQAAPGDQVVDGGRRRDDAVLDALPEGRVVGKGVVRCGTAMSVKRPTLPSKGIRVL